MAERASKNSGGVDHLEQLAREALEATYGNPRTIASLQGLISPQLTRPTPIRIPASRWRGRKLSD